MSSQIVPDDPLSKPFTFIQLNFWRGRLYYPICKFIEREKPDIFSAQEVLSGSGNSKPDHMTAEMLVDLGYFTEMVLGGSGKKYSNDYKLERTEHCISFAKEPYTIVSKNIVEVALDDTKDHMGRTVNKNNYRRLLHTQMRLPDGERVHILNFHGRVIIGGRMGNELCDQDFQNIADYIQTLSGPVILSGDFNLYRDCSSFKPLKALGMRNLNDIYNIDVARNEFSWKPDEAVSHVFINDDVVIDDYYVPTDNVSDHLPLVLKCCIKK